mgnify:CR=1 FL=1
MEGDFLPIVGIQINTLDLWIFKDILPLLINFASNFDQIQKIYISNLNHSIFPTKGAHRLLTCHFLH